VGATHDAKTCNPADPKQARGTACRSDSNLLVVNGPESPDQKWFLNGGGRTPIDPSIQAPSTDEIVVGGEMELFKDARLGGVYTHRSLNNTIEDMSRDEAQTYFIGNPGSGIAKDFPTATRDYDAVTAYISKSWSDDWLAQLSYTWSYLRGNYAGLFRPETKQLDPNINSDFDLVSLTVNRTGPLPGDHTHEIKAFLAKDFQTAHDTHFTLGGAFTTQSGAPTGFWGSHPLYGADEVFVLPRGSGERLPWTYEADAHAAFGFELSKGQKVSFTLDVYNLLNLQGVTATDETYTEADVNPVTSGKLSDLKNADGSTFNPTNKNPNFGRPIAFQDPRTVRFGVRIDF
jgi:hypothetical protein